MVVLKWIGCYIVAFMVLLFMSVMFMRGAFVEWLGFLAIILGTVIYKSVFKPRVIHEDFE